MSRSRGAAQRAGGLARAAASRTGRLAAAVALAIAAATTGLGVALAQSASSHGPVLHTPAVAPESISGPGALPVAEPHAGKGWMSDDLLVRIQGWMSARSGCRAVERAIPDSQSAHSGQAGCSTPRLTTARPPGYSPPQLRAYLGLRGTGAGQTVAIVDAFDNPYATRDVSRYSHQFGLPAPCGAGAPAAGCFKFAVVHPFGFAGVDPGWALESDLDIEMVHAIAPHASITLVEAYDDSLTSMFEAIDYAAAMKPAPAAISNSWSAAEFPGETSADAHCALVRSLCVFAAGDAGNPGSYPAYDPYALAVGGTTLSLTPAGKVGSETAWCCTTGATGGGVSAYEPRPAYQANVNPYPGRTIPDVAFDADPYTGVPVYDTFGLNGQNGWFELGGTSVGTPAWAGILAAADQLRAAAGRPPLAAAGFQAQSLIYTQVHGAGFSDITQGADNLIECSSPLGVCRAQSGYDEVTGWGSPRPGIDTALAGAP